MSRIFISYKRVDKDKVFKIKDQIESSLGEKCWIDIDGIESDALFKNVIIKAINECDIFLFMYSKAHAKITDFEKDWTIRELNFAALKNKRFVFINLDRSRLIDFFAFDYGTKQQVDGTSSEALRHLCSDLKHWLPSTTTKAPASDNHFAHTPQSKEKYVITITRPSESELQFTKTIIDTLGWQLKESYDFVKSIPATIPFCFDQQKAESVMKVLKKVGAEFECHPLTSIENKYEITITKHGDKKLWLVKILHDSFGLGLMESKKLVEFLPSTIPHWYNKPEAKTLVEKLEESGATVTCRALRFDQFPIWESIQQ